MPHKQYLTIRFVDRVQGSNSSDFGVQLKEAVNKINRVVLRRVVIPNTIYNVRSGVNNSILFNRGGSHTATIAEGMYSITDLTSALQTAMNDSDANTYVVSYSSITGHVTIQGSLAFVVNFGTSTAMARLLDFAQSDTGSADTQIGTNVVDLAYPKTLNLYISQLAYSHVTTSSSMVDLATFTVPITENSPDIIFYSTANDYEQEYHYPGKLYLKNIDVRLRDNQGNVVSLNGSEWEMELECETD